MFIGSSLKAAIDIDWGSLEQRELALERLGEQLCQLVDWIEQQGLLGDSELDFYLVAASQVWSQNLDIVGSHLQLTEGVAPDRRISVEEPDMRHGRKSKSKTVRGYKEHIAGDLDRDLILAAAVTPANRPEGEAADDLLNDLTAQGLGNAVSELYVDRAYSDGPLAAHTLEAGGEVVCRSRSSGRKNGDLFPKTAFELDLRRLEATCPANVTIPIQIGKVARFPRDACAACDQRSRCTTSAEGRTLSIANDEDLQQVLRERERTRRGREQLRRRVGIEHMLAHVSAKKGPKARYRGLRKNTFDTRRTAAVYNLESAHRRTPVAA